MSEVSPEIIAKTQKSLGKYVKKPALSEKLLKKPPFRFLHDVIKVVIKETGFLNGLYSDDELNSENVKEKEAKVAFLSKLIDAVKVVSNTELKVRSSKIVAGLEPNETNILLQTIAKSIDKKIDTSQYVAALSSGNVVIKEKRRKKSLEGGKGEKEREKKTNSKESARKESKHRDSSVNRIKKSGSVETPVSSDRAKESSRSKVREDKKEKTSKSKQIKTEVSNKKDGRHRGVEDRTKEKEERAKTKESERDVSKASEKNRTETQADSGITNTESRDASSILDVIDAKSNENSSPNDNKKDIKTVTNEETVSSEKIRFADLESNGNPDEKNTAGFSNARQGSAGLVRPKSARPKSGDRIMSSRGRNDLQEAEGKLEVEMKGPVEIKALVVPAPLPRPPSVRPSSSLRPPSVRPSSARPGAPRLRPESALPVAETVVMGSINVIVENFDSGLGDEEETVVIQNAPEVAEEEAMTTSDLLNISAENKGQLVEQILEQIQEGQDGTRKKVEIDWEHDGLRGKDATTKEVTQLRSFIQSLTKTANPLGKLMNYLHEDLDAMHNELQMWTNTKKQLYMEIEKQKKLTIESSKPLLDKLEHLRQDIKKQEQEILTARSNILRNEQRIAELLGNE